MGIKPVIAAFTFDKFINRPKIRMRLICNHPLLFHISVTWFGGDDTGRQVKPICLEIADQGVFESGLILFNGRIILSYKILNAMILFLGRHRKTAVHGPPEQFLCI